MMGSRRSGSRRGSAMVEFALSSLILIPAFTGTFQFGYSMYLYNELVSAVRAGARYASLANLSNAGDGSVPTNYQTAIQQMVVYGSPTASSGTPVVPGLTTGAVSVGVTFDSGNVPTYTTVGISSYAIDAVFKTFTFTGKPSFTVPYFGKYCSSGSACP
jgi:Flp pilus assembly protein TadG